MAEPEQPAWVATRSFGRAVVVVGVLILLAALSGRVDLVVLAAPVALGTALSLRRRPSTVPRVTLAQADPFVAEGAEIGAAVTVTNPDPVGLDLALVRVHMSPWLRLRRIDWRVTLRTRQLHVVATLSDRDAEVVLLLDVLSEAGRSGGIGGAASVLDTTVRAAATIAEHYLHRGDRVSLLEYGYRARRLPPASGRRQYLRVLEWLLDVRASGGEYEPSAGAFGTHLLSANALVVVLTPLLDLRSAAMIARLARSGRFVVAVDTLTSDVRVSRFGPWSAVAYQLWRLDGNNVTGNLRDKGVPVVSWAGAGSLDQVLRDISRLAAAPRAGVR